MRLVVLHNHPIHYKHLLFTAMAQLGAEVDVLFAARSSNQRTAAMHQVGSAYRSHFLSEGSIESLPQFSTALRAVEVASQCLPDAVIISGYNYLPTWSMLAWAKIIGKPVALWFESNAFDRPHYPVKEFLKRIFLYGCDVGHVYGTSNRQYLEELGMKSYEIVEKRATVDWELFSKRRAVFHSDFRRFIYVGRFSPEKNLTRLMEAFQIVQSKTRIRAELLLVGYGPDESMLRQRTRDLGLSESVVFGGAKTQEEVCMTLAECDCLVLPSLSEPWGLVANEALCVGMPVILSDRCGCAIDLARDGIGWIVGAEDTNAFAESMLKVCNLSIEELRTMGRNAVSIAEEYSPQQCAARIMASLEDLVAKRQTSKPLLRDDFR
ncbi:MAG TPA: glycosyltransferase [Terracidiphilus sp.]|nr:glycosyltransferase [Terracidiphilus sp.]